MAATYKSVGASTTTTATAMYTCPAAKTAYVMLARATNKSGGTDTLTFSWNDTSASATYNLTDTLSIPSKGTVRLLEDRLVLETGDSIKISSAVAASMDVIISIMEV